MMVTAHACDDVVTAALELVTEVLDRKTLQSPCKRTVIRAAMLRYFPEYSAEIASYFEALDKEVEDSAVLAARLQRDYLESRWV